MSFFAHSEGKVLVDATAGGGGHLRLLAQSVGKTGMVLAFDKDPRAHDKDASGGLAMNFDNVRLFKKPFSRILETLRDHEIHHVDGLICDLGVSSNQLDDETRGFSFLSDGPIDMRMDQSSDVSAYDWLAKNSETTIAHVLFTFGGERKSRAIARLIKKSWPIKNSTLALARLIASALKPRKWQKIHPATRSFQAIRMAVNHEVDELVLLLKVLPSLLAPDAVAVFLSFHSVEDRLIKNAFKELAHDTSHKTKPKFEVLTKKPLTASADELAVNRRARSAKLRAIKRIL